MCVPVYLRGRVAHRQLVRLADLTAPSCAFVERETRLQYVNKEASWNKLPVHGRYCHAEFYAVSAQITEGYKSTLLATTHDTDSAREG